MQGQRSKPSCSPQVWLNLDQLNCLSADALVSASQKGGADVPSPQTPSELPEQSSRNEASEDAVLERAEETANVRVVTRPDGGVRVRTVTEDVEEMVTAELVKGEVEVRRVSCGFVVENAPVAREEDGVLIIPVLEERAVIRTELVLVEEIHLIRTETTEQVGIPVTLRRQRAILENVPLMGDEISSNINKPEKS